MKLIRVGVDLAKNVFQLHGVDRLEKPVWRRKLVRADWVKALLGQAINHKRFYRVMKVSSLLLSKAPKRSVSSRVHDGVVSVGESNQRWCSDGFEVACNNGEVVTGVFMKDCCDREIIAWRAWAARGHPSEPVRDMLVEAVEARFGQANVGSTKLEFLSDNGGAYCAHETHALARELGIEPCTRRYAAHSRMGSLKAS